ILAQPHGPPPKKEPALSRGSPGTCGKSEICQKQVRFAPLTFEANRSTVLCKSFRRVAAHVTLDNRRSRFRGWFARREGSEKQIPCAQQNNYETQNMEEHYCNRPVRRAGKANCSSCAGPGGQA